MLILFFMYWRIETILFLSRCSSIKNRIVDKCVNHDVQLGHFLVESEKILSRGYIIDQFDYGQKVPRI